MPRAYSWWLCSVLAFVGCESAQAEAVQADPEARVERATIPPLAKDDPRFGPYVPKPDEPLDFSGVDVGDEPMADAHPSLDALGQAVVDALNRRDAEALASLAITEREYVDRFFPITIHHRSGLALGADLAWAELHGESSGDMREALERFGGRQLAFVRFDVERLQRRPKATLHLRPTLVVKDASGEEQSVVLIGSILEHVPSAGFKVLAFRDTA